MEQSPVQMDEQSPFGGESEIDSVAAGGPGDFAEQRDFEQDAGGPLARPRFNRTTFALIGLFAAGIATVAFMSLRGGPKQASADDKAVEEKVESFITKRQRASEAEQSPANTKDVVEAFSHYESRRQVPTEDLQSNPFVFGTPEPRDQATTPSSSAQEKAAAKRRAELTKELGRLKLQSVMRGQRGSTAIINNNFLIEGQTIGSFTLRKISPRSVELVADDIDFMLHLEE